MTSVTTEPPTLRSIPSAAAVAATSSSLFSPAAPYRRSYSCYNCSFSFHITPAAANTSASSPSSFRCPRCHHRHLIPHHTVYPPPPPRPVSPPQRSDYAPSGSSFYIHQTSDDSDSDYDYDSDDNSILSFTTPDFRPCTPASKSFVSSLPIKIFPPNSTPCLQSCSICMEDFEINPDAFVTVNKLPCEHYFHKDCIVEWLQRSNTCPLCRYKLPVDPRPEKEIARGANEYEYEVEYDAVLVVDLAPTTLRRVNGEGNLSSIAEAASGADRRVLRMNGRGISGGVIDAMRDEDGDILMVDA